MEQQQQKQQQQEREEKLEEENVISQLQRNLNELAVEFYAAVRYATTRHPVTAASEYAENVINPPPIINPGGIRPLASPTGDGGGGGGGGGAEGGANNNNPSMQAPYSPTHAPAEPAKYPMALRHLARDLVKKQKEIEQAVARLPPDWGQAMREQDERFRQLGRESRALDAAMERAKRRKEEFVDYLEGVINESQWMVK